MLLECVVVIGSRVEIVLDDDDEGRYWSVVEFVKVVDQDWGMANTLLCRRRFFDFLSVVRVGSWPFFNNKQNLFGNVCFDCGVHLEVVQEYSVDAFKAGCVSFRNVR